MTAAPTLTTELIDDVLIVTIDRTDQPVNTLGVELVSDFESVFARVDDDTLIRAVVLISGKPDGFIAGADIEQFLELRSSADAERLSRTGQDLLNRLESLRVPVVAAIHGACLGGGLEVALACRYRVCTDHAQTTFAGYAQMLDTAKLQGFAFPSINVTSTQTLNAALKGFADAGSDGIVQISTGGAEYLSGQAVKDMVTGATALAVPCLVTPRNVPLRLALTSAGFRAGPGGPPGPGPVVFSRPLSGPLPEVPGWVTAPPGPEAAAR